MSKSKIKRIEDLTRRIFMPIEREGMFYTMDGIEYQRDKNGCIRKTGKARKIKK